MTGHNLESLISQFAALPLGEKLRFRHSIDALLKQEPEPQLEPRFVAPMPEPDPAPNRRWLKEHQHEYAGQWIALDGERLIAHGPDAQAVFAAAKAGGAYLPLIACLPPIDEPPFAGV